MAPPDFEIRGGPDERFGSALARLPSPAMMHRSSAKAPHARARRNGRLLSYSVKKNRQVSFEKPAICFH